MFDFLKLTIFPMNTANYHLAQLNIAELLYPIDSPQLGEFVANIDRINQIAESDPGFVWRLLEDTDQFFDPDMYLVNMSVWRSVEALKAFTYKSSHVDIMRKRKSWFKHMKSNHMVMWWIPAGHIPSLEEAKAKLEYLDKNGPSGDAFTFREIFTPDQS
ncbi:MAG: DUF3291 domain-containing protein [Bacteroidia bacterium]|nr:DUF3291 domain-containing protein [Bacteroidia bacterium]